MSRDYRIEEFWAFNISNCSHVCMRDILEFTEIGYLNREWKLFILYDGTTLTSQDEQTYILTKPINHGFRISSYPDKIFSDLSPPESENIKTLINLLQIPNEPNEIKLSRYRLHYAIPLGHIYNNQWFTADKKRKVGEN
jgi:hypothetical protein